MNMDEISKLAHAQMRSTQLHDGTFWYPILGWHNFTLLRMFQAAQDWAEALLRGDEQEITTHWARYSALWDLFGEIKSGKALDSGSN
jgi:hypothetical protein